MAAAVVWSGALAWACVGIVSLTTAQERIEPGGTLTVTGREFARGVPVEIRLDSLTGPLLTTVPGPASTMNSSWTQEVTLPVDIAPGAHVLLASQDHHDMNSGQPARATFYVASPPPGPQEPAERPALLAVDQGPGAGTLVLVGLGFAGLGLAAAWAWTAVSAKAPGAGAPGSTSPAAG